MLINSEGKHHQGNLSEMIELMPHCIVAYFDFNFLSTAPLEGTSNKIKTMQRKAYRFENMEFIKLK